MAIDASRSGFEGALDEPTRRAILELRRRIAEVERDGGGGGPGPGGISYVHNQGAVASTWTIAHNLGWYPNVTVIDSGGLVVEGDLSYPNINTVQLQFSGGFSGVAYLS